MRKHETSILLRARKVMESGFQQLLDWPKAPPAAVNAAEEPSAQFVGDIAIQISAEGFNPPEEFDPLEALGQGELLPEMFGIPEAAATVVAGRAREENNFSFSKEELNDEVFTCCQAICNAGSDFGELSSALEDIYWLLMKMCYKLGKDDSKLHKWPDLNLPPKAVPPSVHRMLILYERAPKQTLSNLLDLRDSIVTIGAKAAESSVSGGVTLFSRPEKQNYITRGVYRAFYAAEQQLKNEIPTAFSPPLPSATGGSVPPSG